MCDYTPRVYYTPTAREYHMRECVSSWMDKMSDEQGCVRYMGGIADASLAGCTAAHLAELCDAKGAAFSVSDAHRLCEYQNAAMELFWSEKLASE